MKKHGRQQVKLGNDVSGNGSANGNPDTALTENQNGDPLTFSLFKYFLQEFGPETSEQFMEAQKNFVQSCAA